MKIYPLKAEIQNMSDKIQVLEGKELIFLAEIALEVIQLITKSSLNARQALAVLEMVQAEIHECELVYKTGKFNSDGRYEET